jgi:hypothetical protein
MSAAINATTSAVTSAAVTTVRQPRTRLIAGLAVLAAILLLVGANAHLLYVAVTSQPDCVDHVREGDAGKGTGTGTFRAAKSACSPRGPSSASSGARP